MAQGKHPEWRAVSIVFETQAQPKASRFSVPADVCRLLDVGSKDQIRVAIACASGAQIPDGTRELVSGEEIIDDRVKPGEKIRVTVSVLGV